jgi:hypothetical protein
MRNPHGVEVACTVASGPVAVVTPPTAERVVVDDLVTGLPVREFRWYEGRR